MSDFIFLEFSNPNTVKFLAEIRYALQGNTHAKLPAHITIRGPYKSDPDYNQMNKFSKKMRGYAVRVQGADYFFTPKGYVVFLKASSVMFKKIWWKPDYKESFFPHLTIFETGDKNAAIKALQLLRNADICIVSKAVYLSFYSSTFKDLFGTRPIGRVIKENEVMKDFVYCPKDFLENAKLLGNQIAAK